MSSEAKPPNPSPASSFTFYNLFGKHLTEPSFSAATYIALQVIECLMVLVYVIAEKFFAPNSLKIELLSIEEENILLSMKVLFLFLFALCNQLVTQPCSSSLSPS